MYRQIYVAKVYEILDKYSIKDIEIVAESAMIEELKYKAGIQPSGILKIKRGKHHNTSTLTKLVRALNSLIKKRGDVVSYSIADIIDIDPNEDE